MIGTPTRGKDIDAVLMMAEAEGKRNIDPAYAAHVLPLGRWAEAVWLEWCPRLLLHKSITTAKMQLIKAAKPWAVVNGPAAAAVATAGRLGWTFHDAERIETDDGELIDMSLDPPVVVKRRVEEAVRRWRNRRMVDAAGLRVNAEGDGGAGICTQPLRHLMRPSADRTAWSRAHQAALQSAATNGQWAQQRLHKAGLADHPHCTLGTADGFANDAADGAAVCAEPPVGTLPHRVAACQPTARWHDEALPRYASLRRGMAALARRAMGCQMDGDEVEAQTFGNLVACEIAAAVGPSVKRDGRNAYDQQHDRRDATDQWAHADARSYGEGGQRRGSDRQLSPLRIAMAACANAQRMGQAEFSKELWMEAWNAVLNNCTAWSSWCRAMVPNPQLAGNRPPDDGTFQWIMLSDADADHQGVVYYTDASGFDVGHSELQQFGWAFVAINKEGEVVSAASGRTPPWVTSVSAAEAWALVRAAEEAHPAAEFRSDCWSVVRSLQGDPSKAVGPQAPMARVMKRLLHLFDTAEDTRRVAWMPAHKTGQQLEGLVLSNGVQMTEADRKANEMADGVAKQVAGTTGRRRRRG